MIESILKPIKWFTYKDGSGADAATIICEYTIYKYDDEEYRCKSEISETGLINTWVVAYYNRQTEEPTKEALGFGSIDEAREWCWGNYKMHMQPYFNVRL